MRKQTKLVAVLSAAALLAIGASMTSFAAAGWAEEDGVWVYLDKDGDRVYDTWKKSGNQYFYLDENGEMATEKIVETDDDTFYVDANGAKTVNAWISVENEDGAEVGGNEVDTLWYYFGSNGKAIKATDTTVKVKELDYSGGKAKYLFDTEGHMLSGWQEVPNKDAAKADDLYYLGDENQGFALTGWQQLEPDENGSEAYDDLKWFYFDGGKAVKNKTKYIQGAYYTFGDDGVMVDDWFGASTPPEAASGANAYASGSGALGTGWVYTTAKGDSDGDEYWFYLVNVRDEDGKVARSIPFNFNGEKEFQAKSIKSKVYLFNNKGQMQTGVKELGDIPALTEGTSKGSKELKAGIYYFNKGDGSIKGQMATGKATVETDGENDYYYFKSTGQAYTNTLKDGVLYAADGKRVNAEDGNTYSLYKVQDDIYDAAGEKVKIEADTVVAINRVGRVKTSGTVKIDGETYEVNKDTYHATIKPEK